MMNWRQIYGDDEFAVKAPIFWSDIVRRRQQKGVDMEELRQRAIDYAKSQCQTYNVDYEEVAKGEHLIEWPPMKKEVDLEARVDRERRRKSSGAAVKAETSESGQTGF